MSAWQEFRAYVATILYGWAQAASFEATLELARMVVRMASGLPPHLEAAAEQPGVSTHANLAVAECDDAGERGIEAEFLVRKIAAIDAGSTCPFCAAAGIGDPAGHAPSCLWRMAICWVYTHDGDERVAAALSDLRRGLAAGTDDRSAW